MTNKKMSLHCVLLALLFSVTCAQAQVGQSDQVPGSRRISLPQAEKAARQSYLLALTAAADLHSGNYTQAEAEAREAVSMDDLNGVGKEVLAAALDAQGKAQEALQAYRVMITDGKDGPVGQTRILLPYALLLLKSGQWSKAVTAYNQALSNLGEGDLIRANSHFTADVPEPAMLEMSLHIALGLTYNGQCDWTGEYQNDKALAEYGKALQLAPNSDLANYYYGYGWQRLSPAEKTKLGTPAQAKAALQKAMKLGKGDVKKAAQNALLVAMKTK